jgi:hypothetical protein
VCGASCELPCALAGCGTRWARAPVLVLHATCAPVNEKKPSEHSRPARKALKGKVPTSIMYANCGRHKEGQGQVGRVRQTATAGGRVCLWAPLTCTAAVSSAYTMNASSTCREADTCQSCRTVLACRLLCWAVQQTLSLAGVFLYSVTNVCTRSLTPDMVAVFCPVCCRPQIKLLPAKNQPAAGTGCCAGAWKPPRNVAAPSVADWGGAGRGEADETGQIKCNRSRRRSGLAAGGGGQSRCREE